MFNNVNLNTLKYFYEVANTKNMTKASENLCVSQPALTKAIKQLENDLNTILFNRSKKGVTLTEAGEVLYEYTIDALQKFNSTLNVIEQGKESKGHLYIGATTTNFLEPILPALDEFRKKHKNVLVDIVLEEIDVLDKYRKMDKLDILIKNSYEEMDGFVSLIDFETQDCFIASRKEFKELAERKVSLRELLDNYPFVLLSNITHGRKNFDAFLKSQNITFKPTYEFNSYSLCRELIRNGFGIGIGNPIHYRGKEFIILDTDFKLPKRVFNIGYIKKSANESLEAFTEILERIGLGDI